MMNKLKNWPDEKKRIFSAILAFAITAIIVIFWLGFSWSRGEQESKKFEIEKVYEDSGPIDLIKQSFKEAVGQFNAFKEKMSTSTEE